MVFERSRLKHLMIIACGLILLCGCNPEKRDFKRAKKEDTPAAYRHYINKYPNSPHVAEAEKRIPLAVRKQTFNKVLAEGKAHQYYEFLYQYPEGEDSEIIRTKLDDHEFQEAKRINTLKSYYRYLNQYIKPRHKSEVESLLFEQVKLAGDIGYYKNFLEWYPNTRFLDQIESLLFELVKLDDRVRTYQDFLLDYPITGYRGKIDNRISEIIQARHPQFRDLHTMGMVIKKHFPQIKKQERSPKKNKPKVEQSIWLGSWGSHLKNFGISVNTKPKKQIDYVMEIDIKGYALSRKYTGAYNDPWGRGKTYYTGARVQGHIYLKKKGKIILKKQFSGYKKPLKSFKTISFSHQPYIKPRDAPFQEVLKQPGSFHHKMCELLTQVFGEEEVLNALLPLSYHVLKKRKGIKFYDWLVQRYPLKRNWVRKSILNWLGLLGDNRAMDFLFEVIKKNHLNVHKEKIATAAIKAMGKIGELREEIKIGLKEMLKTSKQEKIRKELRKISHRFK